jgi:hypothetical protein
LFIIKKKLEKQKFKKFKSFINCIVFLYIKVFFKNIIKVNSELNKLFTKQLKQTIFSFEIIKK